jgi:hypothetical protein
MREPRLCECGSQKETYALTDCHGIFMCYVCENCEEEKRKHYNPKCFTGYTQEELDGDTGERIEPLED